jgi:flagellar L-ring protein precursor FlgH
VGDIVTIVIREMTDVDNNDERDMERKSSHLGNLGFSGAMEAILGKAEGDAEANVGLSETRGFGGNSSTKIEREFMDRITARVVDILPNGDLRVEGHREQSVGDEVRVLHVSGWVRPWDIRPDNTVESRQVADFCMKYSSSGEDVDFKKRGWLGRIWQRVRP